jgi:spermidine synthase
MSDKRRLKPILLSLLLLVLAIEVVVFLSDDDQGSTKGDERLAAVESEYNNIYVYREGPFVTMQFGLNDKLYTESKMVVGDELELPVPYTRLMTLGSVYADRMDDILMIGLGGGRTSWYLHRHLPSSSIEAVELDPAVVSLAKEYFSIQEEAGYQVTEGDGRLYLSRSDDTFDIVLVDAYRGPFVPFHLLTQQFYELVESRINDGGCVVQNIDPDSMVFDSAIATVSAVFDHVDLYKAMGNMVAVAYNGEKAELEQLRERAQALQEEYGFHHSLPELLKFFALIPLSPDAQVLTDDFAPVNYLKAVGRHNRMRGEEE